MFQTIKPALALVAFIALSATQAQAAQFAGAARERHVSIGSGFGHHERAPIRPPRPSVRVRRHRTEGHWTTVNASVHVPARADHVWVPPVHETRYHASGRAYGASVRHGYWNTACIPAH